MIRALPTCPSDRPLAAGLQGRLFGRAAGVGQPRVGRKQPPACQRHRPVRSTLHAVRRCPPGLQALSVGSGGTSPGSRLACRERPSAPAFCVQSCIGAGLLMCKPQYNTHVHTVFPGNTAEERYYVKVSLRPESAPRLSAPRLTACRHSASCFLAGGWLWLQAGGSASSSASARESAAVATTAAPAAAVAPALLLPPVAPCSLSVRRRLRAAGASQ